MRSCQPSTSGSDAVANPLVIKSPSRYVEPVFTRWICELDDAKDATTKRNVKLSTVAPISVPDMQILSGIITISDRASKGLYDDLGGPALKTAAEGYGWRVLAEALVPDEKRDIQRAILEQIAKGCHLILTTGGTGVSPRDVTPEAAREIALRELPGFGEAMRMESLKLTRNAILSRSLAVVVDKTLVICLPGKPSGAVECLSFVVGAIPHCIEVLQEIPTSC
jgi:molybdopterin adenylyltransferase